MSERKTKILKMMNVGVHKLQYSSVIIMRRPMKANVLKLIISPRLKLIGLMLNAFYRTVFFHRFVEIWQTEKQLWKHFSYGQRMFLAHVVQSMTCIEVGSENGIAPLLYIQFATIILC